MFSEAKQDQAKLNDPLEVQENDIQQLLNLAHKYRAHDDIWMEKTRQGACRYQGSFKVFKVSGMLHFTASGHGHGGVHIDHQMMNFSHRIDRLSFGPLYPGIKNPLDHTFEIANARKLVFFYKKKILKKTFF